MNKICLLENDYGVRINIHSPQTKPYSYDHSNMWKSSDNPAMLIIKRIQTQQKSLSILVKVVTFPVLLVKKIIQLFEANSFHHPTYPFHFPILIYGDEYSFGYHNYWFLLEHQDEINGKEQPLRLNS